MYNEEMSDIKKWIEHETKKRAIYCPFCGSIHDPDEPLISFYGTEDEGEPYQCLCASCESEFYVMEIVDRIYVSGKRREDVFE